MDFDPTRIAQALRYAKVLFLRRTCPSSAKTDLVVHSRWCTLEVCRACRVPIVKSLVWPTDSYLVAVPTEESRGYSSSGVSKPLVWNMFSAQSKAMKVVPENHRPGSKITPNMEVFLWDHVCLVLSPFVYQERNYRVCVTHPRWTFLGSTLVIGVGANFEP